MPRINVGIVYGLDGRATDEVFVALETSEEGSLVATILTPVEALALAEGIAAVAQVSQQQAATSEILDKIKITARTSKN